MSVREALWRTGLAASEEALVGLLRATCPEALVQVGNSLRVDLGLLIGQAVEGSIPDLVIVEMGTLPGS